MIEVNLGKIITDPGAGRDAIHVAVIPMLAVRRMVPGEKLKNGIVDPYLERPIEAGQRYWLMLYPGTVTAVRHVWTHSAFGDEPVAVESTLLMPDRSFDALPIPPKET